MHDMERFGLSTALPATAIMDRKGRIAFRILGALHTHELVRRLDYLLSDSAGPEPERLVNAFPSVPTVAARVGHDRAEDEIHSHGGVGMEGPSLVPS